MQEKYGPNHLFKISPSWRDELWPSVTSPTKIVGSESQFVCPVSPCRLSAENTQLRNMFSFSTTFACTLLEFHPFRSFYLRNVAFLDIKVLPSGSFNVHAKCYVSVEPGIKMYWLVVGWLGKLIAGSTVV